MSSGGKRTTNSKIKVNKDNIERANREYVCAENNYTLTSYTFEGNVSKQDGLF